MNVDTQNKKSVLQGQNRNMLLANEDSYMISTDELKRHPKNRDPKNIEPLAENIFANGLLSPIQISGAKFNGKYYIIAGERQWRAIQMIRENNPEDHRFDLVPVQMSHASTEFLVCTEIIADNINRENPETDKFRRLIFDLDREYESALLDGEHIHKD